MDYTRLLKKGMSGADVRYIKELLLKLGYYIGIEKIGNSIFGGDTLKAVINFQKQNKDVSGKNLEADGIIGKLTWNSIIAASNNNSNSSSNKDSNTSTNINNLLNSYAHISSSKRIAIEKDLVNVSDLRQKIVLEILEYCYDKDVPGDVRALYMIGANLYNSNLTINIATKSKIESGASRSPSYYNGGRKEWMLEQVKKNPNLPASDCSGMEVGYLRKYKLVDSSFDTTANGLTTSSKYSTAINKSDLQPGDWVGKDGHIGTYVGGGYVVEFYGGAFGCQLTALSNRIGYNFISSKNSKGGAWTRFRRPTFY